MQTVIAFIIIFGALVFFHELGHFIFAKRAGIMVREFAIGMGPKIFGMTKGETVYTLRLLPIGGYVRMAGEDLDSVELNPGYRVGLILNDDNVVEKIVLNQSTQYPNILFMEVEKADLEKELWIEGYDEDEQLVRFNVSPQAIVVEKGKETLIAPYDRQFDSKTVGQRAMAIFAGPLFNFILAFAIFMALAVMQGIPSEQPVIVDISADSPADVAGILPNDKVVSIDGESIEQWSDMALIIQNNPGKELQLTVEREGEEVVIPVTPKTIEDENGDYGQLGIQRLMEKKPLEMLSYAAEQTYFYGTLIFKLVVQLVTGQLSMDALSGPVGIYKTTESMAQHGVYTLMHWAAVLSINLGIMNLLPLPALDGGRLLFFAFEAVRGKPMDRQKEGLVHFVGIVLLMLLMVVVTWNDIQRFFF